MAQEHIKKILEELRKLPRETEWVEFKKRLSAHPEKERKIWLRKASSDWSAQICDGATIHHLDPFAISKAREEGANRVR